MNSHWKHAFSPVAVAAIILLMDPPIIHASEHKYPIFKRTNHRGIPGYLCKGDKDLVWARGQQKGPDDFEVAAQICRQKCPSDWVQTKNLCIKDITVNFKKWTVGQVLFGDLSIGYEARE